MSDVTRILSAIEQGDQKAAEELLPQIYEELRKLAAQRMANESPDHTLQATALVNEAYMRMAELTRIKWGGRTHFLAAAAGTMRRILVDHARRKKHQRTLIQVTLDEGAAVDSGLEIDLLDLEEALSELTALSERQGRMVELTWFGGLTQPEISKVVCVSESTVRRELRTAKAWLERRLSDE